MGKRKVQRSGLNRGNPKRAKSNKENITVHLHTVTSDFDMEGLEAAFTTVPVGGLHKDPNNGSGPKEPLLRPTVDTKEELPDLLPMDPDSDDEHADDEDDEDPEEAMPFWKDPACAAAYNLYNSVPKAPAAGSGAREEDDESDDEDLFQPYPELYMDWEQLKNWDRPISPSPTPPTPPTSVPSPCIDPFANPWQSLAPASSSSVPSSTTPSQPAPTWTFNYSGGDGDDSESDGNGTEKEHTSGESGEESGEGEPDGDTREYTFTVPTVDEAKGALKSINETLRPRRKTGAGYKKCELDLYTRTRLEWLASFLHIYTTTDRGWIGASMQAAHAAQKGPWTARKLREWGRAYLNDRTSLPVKNPYGKWNHERSILEDADVSNEIALHLQSLGKYVRALDIVHYIDKPEVKKRLGLKKGIHLATAQRWMKRMGYRWTKNPSGQFVDGHERPDVVYYRQNEYIPAFTRIEYQTRKWTLDNLELIRELPANQIIVVWFHDESTFYANDRRLIRWVHVSEKAVPRAKGEGASMMAADFVSADYGWLRSKDGTDATRVLFKAGKNRDGYFTNDDIVKQTNHAMDILSRDYADEKHVFVFDNATTHLKRPDDALSARNMPKGTPKEGNNWLISVNKTGADGKPIYDSRGKYVKTQVRMRDGIMSNGTPQPLYFPDSHERAGVFKGMAVILAERGLHHAAKLNAQCKGFKCAPLATACCCRRVLYNQPDFKNQKSIIETVCEARGFRAMFLPKFHCELNFLEQCWGAAKREYRMKPVSSKEEDLERNIIEALDSVSLKVMRRYANRSLRFLDAYRQGLTGKWAAYAMKKYHGHRVLPDNLFDDLRAEGYVSE